MKALTTARTPRIRLCNAREKQKTSTTVAPRSRGEPSSCNTRPHTGKHSHATAAPECTAVGVGRVSPERQLSGCSILFIFAACKESDGNFKVDPSGGIDLNLFFCRARTHYKVSEIPHFVFRSRVAHLKRCLGPDLDIRIFKGRIFKACRS